MSKAVVKMDVRIYRYYCCCFYCRFIIVTGFIAIDHRTKLISIAAMSMCLSLIMSLIRIKKSTPEELPLHSIV